MRNPRRVVLSTELEEWPLATPFRISGHVFEVIPVLVVHLEEDGYTGRGEAAGVYYKGDTPVSMRVKVEAIRSELESGLDRSELQYALAPGGARNAVDCAMWDLEAKRDNRPAWVTADLSKPVPLLTTLTCSADAPEKMAASARALKRARAIKIKLTGELIDADRVRAIRAARPDVWLSVDGNQGFTLASLERLMPVLVEARVELIEQPFLVGQESLVDGLQSPIALAADESVQTSADVPSMAGRFDVVNIKLDKAGGLTEALKMAQAANRLGMDVMVGNMLGTSLAMAPGFLLGQVCKIVDLDGPIFLTSDRDIAVQYVDGFLSCPEMLWGYPTEGPSHELVSRS
jgi:L-Ala-D/L-Glu epimerase